MATMNRLCALHPQSVLTLYCDSCKDAVCQVCSNLGPHADSRHKLTPLAEAAELRRRFYLAYREKQVAPLRERVSLQIAELMRLKEMYLSDRRVIEKDINLQFQGIAQRVKVLVNQQLIRRQTQIKNYQQIINRCDDLAYSFEGVAQNPQRFLLCYKQFDQQIKQLERLEFGVDNGGLTLTGIQPKVREEIKIPRQMALTLANAQQWPLFEEKNNFLNQLVGQAVEYYHAELKKAKKEVIINQKRILNLYNDQNATLLALQSAHICAFCLTAFTMAETNELCGQNKSYKSQPHYKDIIIPPEIKGSKLHFWVPARHSERPIPDIKAHSLVRNLQKKQFLGSLKDIKQVKCKLRIYDIKMGRDGAYLSQFTKDDSLQIGRVSPLAFLFIMTNKFQIGEVQVQVIADLCRDKDSGMIEYTKMEEILSDPLKLYTKFIEAEQELQRSKPIAPPSFKFKY